MKLYEKYRPASFDQIVAQNKAVAIINGLQSRGGLSGQCYYITGPSGCGKTSLARLIASAVADPWDIAEYSDPSELTADEMRRIGRGYSFRPMGKGSCYIVNEVHLLNSLQLGKLLGLIEDAPSHVTWIFTTTNEGQESLFDMQDAGPFGSRTIALPVTSQGVCKPFAARLREVYVSEIGTDGVDEIDFERIVKNAKNNMRAAFQQLESIIAQSFAVKAVA